MIYKNLIQCPRTIQQDGIHPTAKGSNILADTSSPPETAPPQIRREMGETLWLVPCNRLANRRKMD